MRGKAVMSFQAALFLESFNPKTDVEPARNPTRRATLVFGSDPGRAALLRGRPASVRLAAAPTYGLPDDASAGSALVAAGGGGVSRAISRSYSSTSRASPTFFASCSARS